MDRLVDIYAALKPLLQEYAPPFVAVIDTNADYGLSSPKEVVIAGRKRKGIFFASVEIQKRFVGFYFMPVYADPALKTMLPPELLALLTGKSCFHFKQLTPQLVEQVRQALKIGFECYKKNGWV
jgi:hypothetical protein